MCTKVREGQGPNWLQVETAWRFLFSTPRLCASRVYLCHWVRGVAFLGCLVFLIGLELSDWVHHEHHLFSCCHSHEWLLPGAQLEGPLAPTQAPLQLWRPL